MGIVGVAPAAAGTAPVIPVQIADQNGDSSDLTIIRGIRWAVNNGAKVINISAGGIGYSRAFQDTILWASSKGALVVASVGNQGQDVNSLNYPAGLPAGARGGRPVRRHRDLRLPDRPTARPRSRPTTGRST